MSKKHFIAIAATIRCELNACQTTEQEYAVSKAAGALCRVFGEANPRFDRARFLAACGVSV